MPRDTHDRAEYHRARYLQRAHGMTASDLDAQAHAQGNKCHTCRRRSLSLYPVVESGFHTTPPLLCARCNGAWAMLKHDASTLTALYQTVTAKQDVETGFHIDTDDGYTL